MAELALGEKLSQGTEAVQEARLVPGSCQVKLAEVPVQIVWLAPALTVNGLASTVRVSWPETGGQALGGSFVAVSYTHLTLPPSGVV